MDNYTYIQQQIAKKLNPEMAYYGRATTVQNVVTDRDHFPYTRNFRGIYHDSQPHVVEREAGYRQTVNSCYRAQIPYYKTPNPEWAWEAPCSTLFPPDPTKYTSVNAALIRINKGCADRSP